MDNRDDALLSCVSECDAEMLAQLDRIYDETSQITDETLDVFLPQFETDPDVDLLENW